VCLAKHASKQRIEAPEEGSLVVSQKKQNAPQAGRQGADNNKTRMLTPQHTDHNQDLFLSLFQLYK